MACNFPNTRINIMVFFQESSSRKPRVIGVAGQYRPYKNETRTSEAERPCNFYNTLPSGLRVRRLRGAWVGPPTRRGRQLDGDHYERGRNPRPLPPCPSRADGGERSAGRERERLRRGLRHRPV